MAKVANTTIAPEPIVYLIDFFIKGGGTENQLALLIDGLDRQRFQPHLITLRDRVSDDPLPLNCPVHHLGVKKLLSFKALSALFWFVRYLRRNRVKILQLFSIDSNLFGIAAGKLGGVKRIIISRRDMGYWYGERRRYLTNIANRFADYCISNSEAVKKIVNRVEPLPPERTKVIYNGVYYRAPANPDAFTREALDIPADAPVVGIVANLKPIKRIDLFLAMFAGLQDQNARAVIVGSGVLHDVLKQAAKDLKISHRVHFCWTRDDVYAALKIFTVGVLTSETEGLSNVLIEYAVAGLPAVAFDVGGNREVIEDGQTGYLVKPYDVNALAEKVDLLLSNTQLRERLGKQANRRALERFSKDKMVRATEAFYQEIIS